jgi:hypothetical protein
LGAFDRSASIAEHLKKFLFCANRYSFWRYSTNLTVFGIFPPNAAPTVMQAALRGKRLVGASYDGNAIR